MMTRTRRINDKIRTLLFIIAFVLLASIVLVSCGGYGGGGGMYGGSGMAMKPGAFGLTSPGPNAMGVSLTPTLTWNPSAGVTSYTVKVTQGATTVFTGMTAMTSDMISPPLMPNTTYDWQVTAAGIYGQITAGPAAFTTGAM